ncbi:MAG: glycosyltransferase family 1 protein [Gallionella sp.]
MRVAYTHHAFCRRPYTGISRYLTNLASELDATNLCDVKIVAPVYTDRFLSSMNRELVFGHMLSCNSAITRPVARHLNSLLSPHVLTRWAPEVVHETYYSAKPVYHSNCRSVLTVYDMIHEKFPDDFSRWDRTRQLKAKAVSRADHIICISENTRQDLLGLLGVSPEKTSVVHLGGDNYAENLPTPVSEPSLRLQRRPYILYVGRREGHKNFSGMIAAYAASSTLTHNVDVLCFGGGVFSHDEVELLLKFKIASNVFQINGTDSSLYQLFRNALFFVYPSKYEGFGLPPLEAMAVGCVVACSNTSSVPEIAGDAAAYFDPHILDSIRFTLEAVAESASLRTRLRTLGFARRQLFSWKKCARETFNVYRNLG